MSTGGDGELNSEINVTPLVDVMLVLMIIFMITAGVVKDNAGVELDLPQVSAKNLEDPEGKLVLSIEKNNKVHLGGTLVTWAELEVKLKANERVQKESALYIEADTALPYGVVVTAMAVAKNAGVQKVMMLTEPADNLATRLTDLDQNKPR